MKTFTVRDEVTREGARLRTVHLPDDRNRDRHSRIVAALIRRGFQRDQSAVWLDGGWVRFYSGRPIYGPGVCGVQLEWRILERENPQPGECSVRTTTTIKAWTNA